MQASDPNDLVASPVSQMYTVAKANQTITFPTISFGWAAFIRSRTAVTRQLATDRQSGICDTKRGFLW
jgi:hypothetical protein